MASGCAPNLNYNTYTANGTQTNFVITFGYHDVEDIRAISNGVELDNATYAIDPANPTTVVFNSAPSAGPLTIYRCTDLDSLSAQFYAGSTVRAVDLNDNFEQLLYGVQDANNRIAENAELSGVNLGYQEDGADNPGQITNNKGTNATIPVVIPTRAGLMTGTDKSKLDDITVNSDGTISIPGIVLGDNERIVIGDGPDLQLYHDGSNSYVEDTGTGALIMKGTVAGALQISPVRSPTTFNGNLTGNVTGSVTGDVTGNVTGNVTGDLTGDVTGDLTGDVTGNLTGVASQLTVSGEIGDLTWRPLAAFGSNSDPSNITNTTIKHAGSDTPILRGDGRVQFKENITVLGNVDANGNIDGVNITASGNLNGTLGSSQTRNAIAQHGDGAVEPMDS